MIKRLILKVNQNILILKHIYTKKYGSVVRDHEFIRSQTDGMDSIFKDTIKDCSKNYFRSFEHRYVYDIKLKNMEKNEEILLSIKLGYLK